MPIGQGFLARLERQGHEYLVLTIAGLIDIPLYGAVMAGEAMSCRL
jgi:hypothetical protein